MKNSTKKNFKHITAGVLVCVMSALMPMTPLAGNKARAASAKQKYIKEMKVLTLDTDSAKIAQDWCDEQPENQDNDSDNDWAFVDGSLNRGAKGTWHAQNGAVFLVYRTTTDPSEAITDLAVMNEKGNYSEGAFKRLLKTQKDQYIDMVNNMKQMLEEYRANVNKKVPTALQAKEFLNSYVEDDSGKNLGDLLMDISDENLAELFLQMNGTVVLTVEQQLAFACDTAGTTFLDRMVKLGSFDKLRKKFLQAYNDNATKADKALDQNYKEKAAILYDAWDDVRQHLDNMTEMAENNGVADMDEAEFTEWAKKGGEDSNIFTYIQERSVFETLVGYTYEEGTLFDFFCKGKEEFDGDGIKALYPLAACLSEGQFAALSESVSLFMIIQDALGAGIYNEKNAAETKDQKEELESAKETLDVLTEEANKEKTSVYAGVDRDIFDGGVAVTSTAEDYSSGSESTWADHFIDSGQYRKCLLGLTISAAGISALALAARSVEHLAIRSNFDHLFEIAHGEVVADYEVTLRNNLKLERCGITKETQDFVCSCAGDQNLMFRQAVYGNNTRAQKAVQNLYDGAYNFRKTALFRKLKIGFTVFAILLSAADITLSVVALVKYYNRDHLPIPHHMVDLSYNEAKESSYITYRSVRDTEGNCGDVNGGIGKQWLALYQTKDEDAGNPILAPDGENNKLIVQYGSEKTPDGYSPLHLFGSPNTSQNLTFADGENGWSFNDEKGGTYLFFKRDRDVISDKEDDRASGDSQAMDNAVSGTAISRGVTALVGIACMVAGMFIGAIGMNFRRRKNRKIRIKSWLLGLFMVLSVLLALPGREVKADSTGSAYSDYIKNATTVKLAGITGEWYIVKDESVGDAGTLTLLAEECIGTSTFDKKGESNTYEDSTIQNYLSAYYMDHFYGKPIANKIVDGKLYLLSMEEAEEIKKINPDVLMCSQIRGSNDGLRMWWLGTPGWYDFLESYVVGKDGTVIAGGEDVMYPLGVRPALKLNLSSVSFDSSSDTFRLDTKEDKKEDEGASGNDSEDAQIADASASGTVLSGKTTALVGAVCMVVGIFIGAIGMYFRGKREKDERK